MVCVFLIFLVGEDKLVNMYDYYRILQSVRHHISHFPQSVHLYSHYEHFNFNVGMLYSQWSSKLIVGWPNSFENRIPSNHSLHISTYELITEHTQSSQQQVT